MSKPQYQPKKPLERRDLEVAESKLSSEDRDCVRRQSMLVADRVNRLGILGANELLAAVGRWMVENDKD